MEENEKVENNNEKEFAKDAFLAEYNSLREEAIQRVRTQSTVIGWLIGITGTFVGLNIASTPLGMEKPLILNLFVCHSGEATTLFAFLCAGYTVSVELLLSFWIYQLYHMLLISDYIKNKLKKNMEEYLNIKPYNIFGWEGEDSENDIPKIQKNKNGIVLRVLKYLGKVLGLPKFIATKLQPVSLYILSLLGIIGLVISSVKSCNKYVIIATILLTIWGGCLFIVHWNLEKLIKD